jgi:uncharacterized membrane protein YqaE (UPF0057 family)
MKYTKHLIIVSAMLILLSSCGSLSISQKRYSRGLNIDWFAGKDDQKQTTTKVARKQSKTTIAAKPEAGNQPEEIQTIAPESEPNVEVAELTNEIPAEVLPIQKSDKVKISKFLKKTKISESKVQTPEVSKLRHVKQVLKAAKKADADVETLILIILAIIVPPLAVFLYYMELNGQFWLNILLVVLAAVLWPVSKLLILAAVIHALMVVLGMLG